MFYVVYMFERGEEVYHRVKDSDDEDSHLTLYIVMKGRAEALCG